MIEVITHGNAIETISHLPDNAFRLIAIDPPFNTGKDQVGRMGRYGDAYDDYSAWIIAYLRASKRLLTPDGTLYVHLDYREAHYVKVALDSVFGRENFLNEIIWAYDYGARTNRRWPTKHDTILVYVKDRALYHFDSEEVDREPYMAPGLVGKEKAERGKKPTDVWWHTIVHTTGKERTGYPTQKPEGILRRIITASSKPGDTVLDFFAGSGTTGAAARSLGRGYFLVDQNIEAIEVMERRLGHPRKWDITTYERYEGFHVS